MAEKKPREALCKQYPKFVLLDTQSPQRSFRFNIKYLQKCYHMESLNLGALYNRHVRLNHPYTDQ